MKDLKSVSFVRRFTSVKLMNHVLYAQGRDGKTYYEICNEVDVEKVYTDILNQQVKVQLKYWIKGEYRNVIIPRKNMSKSGLVATLPALGVQVTEDNASSLLDYLLYREQQSSVSFEHSKVGFTKVNGTRVFLHQKAYTADGTIESSYTGRLNLHPKGSLEGELKLIKDCVLGSTPLEFAWIIGFVSPLVGYLRELLALENVVIDVFGPSSTGKTTAALLSLSPYVSPNKTGGDGLFTSWMSTTNGLVGCLVDNYGLPVVFDEGGLMDAKNFGSILYQFASGLEKNRLSSESSLRARRSWSCCILSTSENTVIPRDNRNEGIRIRVLSLKNVKWTTSPEQAETITRRLQDNFGFSGIEFAKYLLSMKEEEVIRRFTESKDKVLAALKQKDSLSSRASHKLGIIFLAAEMAAEVFKLDINLSGILSMLVDGEMEQAENRDLGEQAYEFIRDYVAGNINKFVHDGGADYISRMFGDTSPVIPKSEILGKIVSKNAAPTEIWMIRHNFDRILRLGGFADPDVVLHKLREKGLLKADAKKFTKKKVLHKGGDAVRVVVITIKKSGHQADEVTSVSTDTSVKTNNPRASLPNMMIDEF
ncbi:DUF927 domain-containing protein [Proteiniclasticum ruminis]|uniref:DUF927 domain-containing protein n=1 Tax=Proteiniclasticum ruminis TaxID=398199 RepID=UPI0028A66E66|nr:DUF927 domain-containing protein [Proteiniclasticum ruminis]